MQRRFAARPGAESPQPVSRDHGQGQRPGHTKTAKSQQRAGQQGARNAPQARRRAGHAEQTPAIFAAPAATAHGIEYGHAHGGAAEGQQQRRDHRPGGGGKQGQNLAGQEQADTDPQQRQLAQKSNPDPHQQTLVQGHKRAHHAKYNADLARLPIQQGVNPQGKQIGDGADARGVEHVLQHQQASAARTQRLPQTVSMRVATPALTRPGFGQEQTGRQHRQQGHKRRQQAGQGEAPLGAREQATQQRAEHQAQAERGAHQPHTAGAIGGRRHIRHHRRGHGKITGHDPGQRPRRIDRPQRVGQGEKNVGRGGAEGTDHQNRLAPEAI